MKILVDRTIYDELINKFGMVYQNILYLVFGTWNDYCPDKIKYVEFTNL